MDVILHLNVRCVDGVSNIEDAKSMISRNAPREFRTNGATYKVEGFRVQAGAEDLDILADNDFAIEAGTPPEWLGTLIDRARKIEGK